MYILGNKCVQGCSEGCPGVSLGNQTDRDGGSPVRWGCPHATCISFCDKR